MSVSVKSGKGFQKHDPGNALNRKAVIPGVSGIDYEAIARAEQALSELSSSFNNWMLEECHKLADRRTVIHRDGPNRETLEALFHVAHDIKGQAATLGFPLASGPATSLCKLLYEIPRPERAPIALIDQHVDAICAIVRENIQDLKHKTTVEISRRLVIVTDDFLRQEESIYAKKLEAKAGENLAPNSETALN